MSSICFFLANAFPLLILLMSRICTTFNVLSYSVVWEESRILPSVQRAVYFMTLGIALNFNLLLWFKKKGQFYHIRICYQNSNKHMDVGIIIELLRLIIIVTRIIKV